MGGPMSLTPALLSDAAADACDARRRLFDEQFDQLYWLLRLAMPSPADVGDAVVETLVRAIESRTDCPATPAEANAWLRRLALARVAAGGTGAAPVAAPSRGRAADRHLEAALAGLSDR